MPVTDDEKRAAHAARMRASRAAAGAVTGRVGRPPEKPHGTYAAYKRHQRERAKARAAGIPEPEICQPCKDAWAKDWREKYGPKPKTEEVEIPA
jgi:hypothetical protein